LIRIAITAKSGARMASRIDEISTSSARFQKGIGSVSWTQRSCIGQLAPAGVVAPRSAEACACSSLPPWPFEPALPLGAPWPLDEACPCPFEPAAGPPPAAPPGPGPRSRRERSTASWIDG
jgi:hypothetical protein